MSGPRHRIHHNARRSCDRQHRYGDHQSQGGYRKIKRDGEKAYDHHMSQKYSLDRAMPSEDEAYEEDNMQGYHWSPRGRGACWSWGRIETESESSDSDTDLENPDYLRALFPSHIQWEGRRRASTKNDSQKIRAKARDFNGTGS